MGKEIFESVIKSLETVLDKKGNHLDLQSIIVTDGDSQLSHYFKEREKVDIRSIAKPIVCMAIGAAIDNGLLFDGKKINLDTKIWPYLSQYANISEKKNEELWSEIKLIDLFKITLGHDKGLMFSKDIHDRDVNSFVDYVVNYPISGRVGEDFTYSNAGTFIVSTLITEYLGINIDSLVDELIFSPLGIKDYSWKKYGKYCAGCTGLKLFNEDLHKISKLLINNDLISSKQIVPIEWMKKMKSPQVTAPTHRYVADREFPKWSYGMNLWICQDGNYYCDGTDGQYLIILPKKKVVITTLGYQSDTTPVSACLGAWK